MRNLKATVLLVMISICINAQTTLIPLGSSWKYLAQGSAAPSNWNTTSFSDATWVSGNGQLGFGDGDETTTTPQVVSGSTVVTTYFRKTISMTAPTACIVNMIVDDGSVVYVNGVEVNRFNLPTGTILYSTLTPTFTENAPVSFNIPASNFVAGTNVIAVEVHQNALNSSDLSFDFEMFYSTSSVCTIVSTLAGSGAATSIDGTGSAASFYAPSGVCTDTYGNVYVADRFGHKIRKITPSGVVTTFAGSGYPSSTDGVGIAATFGDPAGICIDALGNLYVADWFNTIRKITPSGVVTTIAGSSATGSADGIGTAATFDHPSAICIDGSNNLYVADKNNNKIRKITPSGVVSTFAGNGTAALVDGLGTSASFFAPTGICIDPSGNLYVAGYHNHCIRKITSSGMVSTFAGSYGSMGSADGTGAGATFTMPSGIFYTSDGNLLITDEGNHTIRKSTLAGVVTTIAGFSASSGSTDGAMAVAKFNTPFAICTDVYGNIYIGDTNNNKVRKITCSTFITTDIANNNDVEENIVVYPNPSKSIINIKGLNTSENIKAIVIRDILGREMLTTSRLNDINIEALSSGNYIISIINSENLTVKVLRFVKD